MLEVADSVSATPEQIVKALDLLKEYEDYGTKRLDDEREVEQSILQWERVLREVDGLRSAEKALIQKQPAVAQRLKELLASV